ncbi:MAG: hypothetical protein GX301_12865 [Gracilibacteraceae bacterium]|nr:hypothetical protein [Gracilibacteraceae bacterium]
MKLQGRIKAGARTKNLVNFLCPGDIAVICHDDIDGMSALAIVNAGVKAVINAGKSMTGRFAAAGAAVLLDNNVALIDVNLPIEVFKDNDMVTVLKNDIIIQNHIYKNVCTDVNRNYIKKRLQESNVNEKHEILKFIKNTVKHAASEIDGFVSVKAYPELITRLSNRHVVVAVRNSSTLDELNAIKAYIRKYNPVFIGVDGGADMIINSGYTPDLLIGDMDSVSDIGIYKSREIILHAYEDGYCPCLDRITGMNVPYKILAVKGTSEDAALMLAYSKGAKLIVLAGGHNCMYDFMSKGRSGMASTFIVRTLIGEKLVDCRGFGIISAAEDEGKDTKWAKM